MSDKPILFSAPMVRALLAGTKTQTRRMIKPQPHIRPELVEPASGDGPTHWAVFDGDEEAYRVPIRIAVGDRLYVRETWAHYQTVNHIRRYHGGASSEVSDGLAGYRADGHDTIEDFRKHVRLMSDLDLEAVEINGDRWRPSIHMPRWASRITLTITDLRVQRLQDISEDDAIAEGCKAIRSGCYVFDATAYDRGGLCHSSAVMAYSVLWDEINGEGSWDANPWVVAYSFDVAVGNIDSLK